MILLLLYSIFLLRLYINPIYPSMNIILCILEKYIFLSLILLSNFSILNKEIKIFLILLIILIYKKIFYTSFYLYKLLFKKENPRSLTFNFTKNIFNLKHNLEFFEKINFPTIIVSNYCYDRLENIFLLLLPNNPSVIMSKSFLKYIKLNIPTIPLPRKKSFNFLREEIRKVVQQKNTVFCYVTKNSNIPFTVGKIKSGIFSIAKDLKIKITPLTIDQIITSNGNIPKQNFQMRVDSPFLVNDVKESMYKVRKIFSKNLKLFKAQKFLF